MRAVRRALSVALAACLTSVSLSACSGGGGDDTVVFGYIPDYNGASLLAIAEEQGMWKDAGVSIELKEFTDGPTQVQGLGAGDLDFGYLGPGAFWLPASGQSKIVSINTLAYADRVIAQPGLTSMEDLEGKKVGVPEGTSGEMVLNLALEEAGMTSDDIDEVPMDPATIVTAFSSGKIDAAGIWYPLINDIKKDVPDLEEVASTRDMEDAYFPTAFVAGNEVDDETISDVVSVLQKANDYREQNPDEAVAAAADMVGVDVKTMTADASNVETLSTDELAKMTEDGSVDGWLNDLATLFVDAGQLDEVPDPSEYYTADLYTEAAQK